MSAWDEAFLAARSYEFSTRRSEKVGLTRLNCELFAGRS